MKFPVLIINFKTYPSATGKRAEHLAEICNQVARETGKSIMIAVQATDISQITKKVKIPVLAQHFEALEPGRNTGSVLAEAIKSAGAFGSLLNHSEHQIDVETLKKAIKKAEELNLKTIVCAKNVTKAKQVAKLEPDVIAIEPPELISGKTSVSEAKPELIIKAVKAVHKTHNLPVLCGAGVHDSKDVRKALELGAKGVLVASAVCKSYSPEHVIRAVSYTHLTLPTN